MNQMISPQIIQRFLDENFGDVGKMSANGQEFIMPSPFVDRDYKCHFSINRETGLFQDFKTGKAGNFIRLYAFVKKISYKRAEAELLMKELLEDDVIPTPIQPKQISNEQLLSGLIAVNINSINTGEEAVLKAWNFLFTRKLFNIKEEEEEPFYLCTEGKYKDRLIIPFKNSKNSIFYFQARSLFPYQKPKYLNPSGNYPKPSTILYPYRLDDHLIICEGPLDAISLQLQGLNATCTMGCHVSEIQAKILADFEGKIILGYDNDKAGTRGIQSFERLRKKKLMPEFYILPPPKEYNDWNDAHIQKINLKEYMLENTHKYTFEYTINSEINQL